MDRRLRSARRGDTWYQPIRVVPAVLSARNTGIATAHRRGGSARTMTSRRISMLASVSISVSVSALAAAGLVACGGKAQGTGRSGGAAPSASLYDRLGRRDAIVDVVKDFVEERVAKDDRIKAYFARANLPDLEVKLVDQICEVSGGPCK